MQETTLGLDVGTASIGWALVDENTAQIVATGVRVFPEGVDRDQQGGEKSKTQTRRDARGGRRQLLRRRRRKHRLRDLLTQGALLPGDRGELEELLAQNPYPLRGRALDEKLEPYQIGRVLIHLNQRRGFLSNRKTDRARAKETKGMLAEISDLATAIDDAHCRTLGEYLAGLDGRFTHRWSSDGERVRHRHTRRDMFETEFDAIWAAQQQHHPSLCTAALGEQIRRVIFFQRKMYWPKSVVGRSGRPRRADDTRSSVALDATLPRRCGVGSRSGTYAARARSTPILGRVGVRCGACSGLGRGCILVRLGGKRCASHLRLQGLSSWLSRPIWALSRNTRSPTLEGLANLEPPTPTASTPRNK